MTRASIPSYPPSTSLYLPSFVEFRRCVDSLLWLVVIVGLGEELERLGVMRDVQSFWEEIIDGHAGTVPVEYFIHLGTIN